MDMYERRRVSDDTRKSECLEWMGLGTIYEGGDHA